MKRIIRIFALVLFVIFSSPPSRAESPAEVETALSPVTRVAYSNGSKEFSAATHALWLARNWNALEKSAAECRQSKAAWPTGAWKLDSFYEGAGTGPTRKKKTEEEMVQALALTNEWIRANPKSLTARIALASELHNYAWFARGSGYANTITPDGSEKMKERETAALQVLRDARLIKSTCPKWWAIQLKIGRDTSASSQSIDQIFNECIGLYPSYYPAYFEKVIYLQPRWSGRPGEWEKFAADSAEKISGVEGDKLYAQMIWKIDSLRWYRSENLFSNFKLDWPRTKRGFASLVAQYPNDVALLSEFCVLSCFAGDLEQARVIFVKLHGRCDTEVWDSVAHFERFRNLTFNKPGAP